MIINNFRGDLTDVSAQIETLVHAMYSFGIVRSYRIVRDRASAAVWPLNIQTLSGVRSRLKSPYGIRCLIRNKSCNYLALVIIFFARCCSGSCSYTLMKYGIFCMCSSHTQCVFVLAESSVWSPRKAFAFSIINCYLFDQSISKTFYLFLKTKSLGVQYAQHSHQYQ